MKHELYGELRAELNVDSRKKAAAFVKNISEGTCSPLNRVTHGYHYHTITAESEEELDEIEEELRLKHFLVKEETQE